MFRRKTGRAGFTLVEIMIAIAISSVVVMASSRLLISILNQYNSNNDDINLQTEVEEILNLMENVIMEADSVTILDSVDATTSSGSSGAVLRVDQSEEDSSGNTVYYYYLLFQDGNKIYESIYSSDDKETWSQAGSRKKIYLGTHVADEGLLFTLTDSETAVFVDISMENGSATYDASRKILLRNLTNGYKSDDSEKETTTTSATTAATTTAAETTTTTAAEEETTTAEPQDNDISVTASAVTLNETDKYYTISITLKNNGNPVPWSDLTVDYYVNYPGRYNFDAVLSGFTCQESSVDCEIRYADLSSAYTDAVGKITMSFTDSEGATFGYGEEAVIEIRVGNKTVAGTWGNLYVTDNNASHLLTTSYSALSKSNIVITRSGEGVIFGTAPTETAADITYVDIDITDFTVDTGDSAQYTISFNLKNSGMDIAWSDLDLRFFYITPEGRILECTLDSCSSDEISLVSLSCESIEISGTYSNATDYLKFTIGDTVGEYSADGNTGMFYKDEVVNISFKVKYDDATSLETAGSLWSFTNSHSLLSGSTGNYMGVYYKDTLLSSSGVYGEYNSYVAPDTVDTTRVQMQVAGATYKYNSDGTECTVSFTAQNLGKDVDWSDVTLQYYIMVPSAQNDYLYIKDCSYTLNGDSSADIGNLKVSQTKRDTALEGSTHYITVGFDSTSAELETYDSVTFTFTIYYSDGTELEDSSSNYSFSNSYSLAGDEYITIYHSESSDNPVWGTEPSSKAASEILMTVSDDIKLMVSDSSYSTASGSLSAYVELTNYGSESINLKYVQVRFFYYLEDGTTFDSIYQGNSNYYLYKPSAVAYVSLSNELDGATGYIKASWESDVYLSGSGVCDFTVNAYSAWNVNLLDAGIDDSYSLTYGVAVYYKGELIYGYEPSDISSAYGTDDGFDEYADTVTPTNLTIASWYAEGKTDTSYYNINGSWEWNVSAAKYYYYFYVKCDNMPELDISKFKIRIYQYYDEGTVDASTFSFYTGSSYGMNISSLTLGFYEDEYNYIDIYNLVLSETGASYIGFDITTYLKNAKGASLSSGYLPDGTYPVEVYYDGVLVYPASS